MFNSANTTEAICVLDARLWQVRPCHLVLDVGKGHQYLVAPGLLAASSEDVALTVHLHIRTREPEVCYALINPVTKVLCHCSRLAKI